MTVRTLARDELWEVAATEHGFVTARQAAGLGIDQAAVGMLAQRGTLDRVAFTRRSRPSLSRTRVEAVQPRGAAMSAIAPKVPIVVRGRPPLTAHPRQPAKVKCPVYGP